MIYSMTGYGRGEASTNGMRVSAEVRTLNSRFFDFSFRASRTLQNYENELRELCRGRIQRGKLALSLVELRTSDAPPTARLDTAAAQRLARELSQLAKDLGLDGGVTLEHLLHFPELLVQVEDPTLSELLLRLAREATDAALTDLCRMRREEGNVLAADMSARLDIIESAVADVSRIQGDVPMRAVEKLRERVKRLSLPQAYDEYRLEMELAILADRLDISEELVRLRGHIEAFRKTLQSPEGVAGKRLEFLLQEMHREANTVGSKTSSLEISHLGVRMREEIERLREQVQNIE
ncbi:YicC family protein [candidate division KSB1 bacterium]|nr:MAG: YicC family protein [candidate division KSB1 bacterium]